MKNLNIKAIENYILDKIRFDDASLDALSDDRKLAKVYHRFIMEMVAERHDLNEKELFAVWMQGLPTNFNVDFICYDHFELLDKWNGKLSNNLCEVSNTFYKNVTDTFYDLLKKYNIN